MNYANTTISQNFISHVSLIYRQALAEILKGKGVRHGINGYTHHGYSAYVLAVASVEAFMNEAFLSVLPRMMTKDSPLWKLENDWIEQKVTLNTKLILVPYLLFGETFARDIQPLQDMNLLIKVRNDLVHYRMPFTKPKYFKPLEDRRIILVAHGGEEADYPLASKLNCSEGIRWAHNTACETVKRLAEFAGDKVGDLHRLVEANFPLISQDVPRDWFQKHGIDPDSSNPKKPDNDS